MFLERQGPRWTRCCAEVLTCEVELDVQAVPFLNVCCALESDALTVAANRCAAKRWRRSRDRGLCVLWLATAHNLTLAAAGRAARKARAHGTLALRDGEQAAEGQTARLSDDHAPGGAAACHLAQGLNRCQADDEFGAVWE